MRALAVWRAPPRPAPPSSALEALSAAAPAAGAVQLPAPPPGRRPTPGGACGGA